VSRCRVARLENLAVGQLTLVEADGTRVVLARVKDDVFACSDECSHQAALSARAGSPAPGSPVPGTAGCTT